MVLYCGMDGEKGMKGLAKRFAVSINTEHCKACGICMALCPKGILRARHDGKVEVIDEAACIGCKSCSVHCPDFCFVIKEAEKEGGAEQDV